MDEDHPADRTLLDLHRRFQQGFATEAAVYGTILVSGLIAVSSAHGETSLQVLVAVAVTVLVFWGSHVYAGTLSRIGGAEGQQSRVRPAFEASLRHSFGMLSSALVPCVFLVIGVTRLVPDELANNLALWAGIIVLLLLGYIAFLRRGSGFWIRILGALGTASFGLVFVVLKGALH
ncbi:hypothetical protein [Agromyces seonyuensis]|uniref:Uncharacterized protein n=1 Tax=Agromyces seonyuensis TaxID=2662446 RepID=A0A6I4NVV5_9MICO|nr:hypothetical protein [Agromyces seonyuensis]MWB98470.1 hypothetical protein [Agromyces seonyuensis]